MRTFAVPHCLIGRVDKTDEPVLAPAFIISFGADGIQFAPSGADLDTALCYALAYQRLFHPVGAPLRKPQIVEPVPSRRGVSVDLEPHMGMILQPLDIALESIGI